MSPMKQRASEQSITRILIYLSEVREANQSTILQETGHKRETVSRSLNDLEAVGLATRWRAPDNKRLHHWRITFLGLMTTYTWHLARDMDNPRIEKMAEAHRDKWILLGEYAALKKTPEFFRLINLNIRLSYPQKEWATVEGFIKTHKDYIRFTKAYREHAPAAQSTIDPEVMMQVQFMRTILGFNNFLDAVQHDPSADRHIRPYLGNRVFREFIHHMFGVEQMKAKHLKQMEQRLFPEAET